MPHATKKCPVCLCLCSQNRTLKFHIRKNHLELEAKQEDQPPQNSEAWMHEPQCSVELTKDVSEITNQQPPASTSVSAVTDRPSTDASTQKRPSSDPDMVSDHPAKARTVDQVAHCRHIRRVAGPTIANTATQTATHQPKPSRWTQYQRGKQLCMVPYGRVVIPSTELTEFTENRPADQRRHLCDTFPFTAPLRTGSENKSKQ